MPRFWITHNGHGGGAGRTFAEAFRNYQLALRLTGMSYAYRGK